MPAPILVVCIGGCILAGCSLLYFINAAKVRQILAFKGDSNAAKRLILPCYRPLFRGIVAFYACFAISLGATFANTSTESQGLRGIVQYFCFSCLALYCIAPVLLLQSSVSFSGFWRTFFTIFPWWLVCNILWGCSFFRGSSQVVVEVYFLACASIPPFLLSACMLSKLTASRVQVGSSSNRNSIEFLLVFSMAFGLSYAIDVAQHTAAASRAVELFMIVFSFVSNQLFPFALYRTLLADTKFWRGLGKHNRGGIDLHESLRETGVDVHRPSMDLHVASSSFQEMMTDIGDISIDFAFLQLERVIGQGATSKVFSGKYKAKLVAIKLSTPPEVTQDVIDVFVAEAKIAAALKHVNIVRFIGICVRPPQIAMVFEFCEGGNLKTNLERHRDKWTPLMRLRACVDASRGVACLHAMGFIHRDLKAENYFVGYKHVVKLGDFGESTRVRNKESTTTKRMTILGTVSFMAPELIAASKHYTQSVDVYALAMTCWEIWTGLDPYASSSQFDIYKQVAAGERPELPASAPAGFCALLARAWQHDAVLRPSAEQFSQEVEQVSADFKRRAADRALLPPPGDFTAEEHSGAVESPLHTGGGAGSGSLLATGEDPAQGAPVAVDIGAGEACSAERSTEIELTSMGSIERAL